MSCTRPLDEAVCGRPLALVLQFQRLCLPNSSRGRMRITSPEKATKKKEDSDPNIPYQRRKAFREVALDFPASPSELASASV